MREFSNELQGKRSLKKTDNLDHETVQVSVVSPVWALRFLFVTALRFL